jgi:transposase
LDRDGGDLARTRRRGLARLESAVRREVTRPGGQKPCLRIVRRVFSALSGPAGVTGHRRGALERAHLLMTDWREAQRRLAGTETRMVTAGELRLTDLVTSITSLSAAGAATILAQTGDLTRFATARALARHAGLAPREKISGSYAGRTKMTGQAARACGSRPGGRSGEPSAATPSSPPATKLGALLGLWGVSGNREACAHRDAARTVRYTVR